MPGNNIVIQQLLVGENAFYNRPDYREKTREDMLSSKPPSQPIYTYHTEHKTWRMAKNLISVIIFPIGVYRLIHALAGTIIVPASVPFKSKYADRIRNNLTADIDVSNWKIKRVSIEVDGAIIDATIMGTASTLGNGRWVLASNGNSEFYETTLNDYAFRHFLTALNGNVISFNYPGVGSSTGMPNREAMAKAYRAMLNFLEDQEKGIGAREIIGYGHSIGGGVQGDALLSHELKQTVNYVFVKSRTFSDLTTIASHLTIRLLGFLAKVFGWNISSVESSKQLMAPEIILQTANVSVNTDISTRPEAIIDDGVISAEASLAKKLLDDQQPFLGNKYFMGIPEMHNDRITNPIDLVTKINEMLNAG